MGSNLMAAERRRQVLETSLRTSVAALRDPGPIVGLAARFRFHDDGSPLDASHADESHAEETHLDEAG
jgi:hypothetical protein